MKNPGFLHTSAVTVAALLLFPILSGAYVTSGDEQAWAVSPGSHAAIGIVMGVVVLALAVLLTHARQPPGVQTAGWTAVATLGLNAWLGWKDAPPLTPVLAILHALLAPLPLAVMIVVAVLTSASWGRGPEPTGVREWPFLPVLATWAPLLVLIQIGLGAGYRHKIAGVLPHMLGALVVTLTMLAICIAILQHFSDHNSLRRAAVAGLSIVLAQIAIGIGAFGMRLLDFDNSPVFVVLTIAHVTNGALTLAASVLLAIQVRKNIRPG
jgi:hypothetical protein